MEFVFTLIEIDDNNNVIETIIDEPNGWQNISLALIRDQELHGMGLELSAGSLEFINEGYFIIKRAYQNYGVDANIGIRIDWECENCYGPRVYIDGKLDFRTYKEICGFDCRITLGIIDKSLLQMVKDRQDIDVDLTSNLAYDGTTTLADYAGLAVGLMVPSKALYFKAEVNTQLSTDFPNDYNVVEDADFPGENTSVTQGIIIPRFNNSITSEIQEFTPSAAFDYFYYSDNILDALNQAGAAIITLKPGTLSSIANTINIDLRVKGTFFMMAFATFTNTTLTGKLSFACKYGPDATDAFPPLLLGTWSKSGTVITDPEDTATIDFDVQKTFSVQLNDGEKIWPVFILETTDLLQKPPGSTPITSYDSLLISLTADSYFKANQASVTEASPATADLIHEAGSRIIEHITNNQLKLKSSLYGRTDSQPFSFPADGCNGLLAILNGLLLRRAVLQDGSKPKVFTSFKKMYDSLNALDCIGAGIEYDEAHVPFVAIEDILHFYQPKIVFIADHINEVTVSIKTDRIYNNFNLGFDKFETESVNGLDAIHTKRQYRTPIVNTDQTIEKICKYIFDGYAIEVTRRKYGITDDWRYDQDIFGLCLKRGKGNLYTQFTGNTSITWLSHISIQVPLVIQNLNIQTGFVLRYNGVDYDILNASFFGGFLQLNVTPNFPANGTFANQLITIYSSTPDEFGLDVEQGNISGATGILDPSTLINYRVSPVRNAMRWFPWVMQGVKGLATGQINEDAKMIFSSGSGNYIANGELTGSACIIEKEAMAENESIDLTKFFNPISGTPFIIPETVEFTYPLGLEEYLFLKENMYGLIQWRQNEWDGWHYGWIQRLEPNHQDGDAKFTLISAVSTGNFETVMRPTCPGHATIINSVEPTLTGVIVYGSAYPGTLNDIYGSATIDGPFVLLIDSKSAEDLIHGVSIDTAGSASYFRIRSYNTIDDCDYGDGNIGSFYCTPEPVITGFTDNGNGTINITIDQVLDGSQIQLYAATSEAGTYSIIGSPITAAAGVNTISNVDATVFSFFKVGVTDAVCDYGFSNIINFVYNPCGNGIAPTITNIDRSGTDIIIKGTSVAGSNIQVFGSTSQNGTYIQLGNATYTSVQLTAGITLTSATYGSNLWFKVYSFTDTCIFGFSSATEIGGGTEITDTNPVPFISTDVDIVIPWTASRIALYGRRPMFQVWIFNEFTGNPELTTTSLYADIPYPNTTSYTYHNSGGNGYVMINGNPTG
jgi:hypothetical protein